MPKYEELEQLSNMVLKCFQNFEQIYLEIYLEISMQMCVLLTILCM
jgi:hypothetical protein